MTKLNGGQWFLLALAAAAIYLALSGPGETYRERLVRCNDQRIASFEMCMGWVEGRF